MKRPGENLARTIDGAPYNKLQRPDNFPLAPARPPTATTEDIPTTPHEVSPLNTPGEEYENIAPSGSSSKIPRRSKATKNSRRCMDTGMEGALPGLDESTDNESSDDSDTREALRYLRQVRAQARDLPHVVNAVEPDSAIYTNGYGDSRGYYSDGAYVAAPQLGPTLPTDEYSSSEGGEEHEDDNYAPLALRFPPQEAYTAHLLSQFHRQRALLHTKPTKADIESLPITHPVNFPREDTTAYVAWRRAVHSSEPLPVQLAAMGTGPLLRLLRLVTGHLRRGRNMTKRISGWIWAILAKLDERELDADNMFIIRQFGKKAVWMRLGFDETMALQTEAMGEEFEEPEDDFLPAGSHLELDSNPRLEQEERQFRRRNTSSPEPPDHNIILQSNRSTGINSASHHEVEIAKHNLLKRISSPSIPGLNSASLVERAEQNDGDCEHEEKFPNLNTRATLDMIITIVGEIYGQRDLLDARLDWVEMGQV